MKKVLLLVSILLVAVVSTACINNIAVQDLNNKALEYMEKGDYIQAIERLKSSIDLDPSVYETHYNLAVAYTNAEDYINAVEEYKKAEEIKPNQAEIYYSLATAQNNLAVDMKQGKIKINPDKSLFKVEYKDDETKTELSEEEKLYIEDLNNSAIENYEKYLQLEPNAENKENTLEQIENIKDTLNNTGKQNQ